MVLCFVTGEEDEPLLGFDVKPETEMKPAMVPKRILINKQLGQGDAEEGTSEVNDDDLVMTANFIPSASTCINRFYLPRPDGVNALLPNVHLPDDEALFRKYDMAFLSDFFGKR